MVSANGLKELSDSPVLVFATYLLVLTPLALYVYHDVLDTRWRPVWSLVRYLCAYVLLYITSGIALIFYIVVQVYGQDYKEVGATSLALILGTYGAWKLIRLARIIHAHHSIVLILRRIDAALCKLTGLPPVGLEYYLFSGPKPDFTSTQVSRSQWDFEMRHNYISSSLFDDDFPGEAGARIRWLVSLRGRVDVLGEDADECASRLALWMRLVLRRPRSEPWRLLTSTSPLVQGHLCRISLGEALRALITNGSIKPTPMHVPSNPSEKLLNGESLTEVGVGFFWVASEMGAEEMTEVLGEMPPRWMRGVTQNGKQLMFEIVMSLLLCDMPEPKEKGLKWILSLPVLDWKRDVSEIRTWNEMARVCADAVVCVMPRYSHTGEMPRQEEIYEIVRSGVYELKDAISDSQELQGDLVGLSLIEIIRASYRAGYLAERILGADLEKEIERIDQSYEHRSLRLYKAEIVTGLFSILLQLGQDDNEPFKREFEKLKEEWGVHPTVSDVILALQHRAAKKREGALHMDGVASSRYWFLVDRSGRCEDPVIAFAAVSSRASELAPFVMYMLRAYLRDKHVIKMNQLHGNPDKYREPWMRWKTAQAHDISRSAGVIDPIQLQSLNSASSHLNQVSRSVSVPVALSRIYVDP